MGFAFSFVLGLSVLSQAVMLPEYWEKEYEGLKPCTVRRVEDDDPRMDLITKYMRGEVKALYIEIVHTGTREKFLRLVTDITRFEGLIIISWNPNHINDEVKE